MVYSENYIEQRINHFSRMIELATSLKAQQFAVKKMLEWKGKRLELERMKKARGSV